MPDMLTCSRCHEDRPERDFYERAGARSKSYVCKECFTRAYCAKKGLVFDTCEGCNSKRPLTTPTLCKRCLSTRGLRRCESCRAVQSKVFAFQRRRSVCRTCSDGGYLEPAEKRRHGYLLLKYGLTLEAYENMWNAQGGLCAICRASTPLVVDHNHATGKVRALLCEHCNRGIGMFREQPEAMRAGARYVELHGVPEAPTPAEHGHCRHEAELARMRQEVEAARSAREHADAQAEQYRLRLAEVARLRAPTQDVVEAWFGGFKRILESKSMPRNAGVIANQIGSLLADWTTLRALPDDFFR